MKLQTEKKMGTVEAKSGAVKEYRSNPGDLTLACVAAHHYARRDGRQMVVIPGNSYGHAVNHITTTDDSLRKYTVSTAAARVAVVTPEGDVFQATATD